MKSCPVYSAIFFVFIAGANASDLSTRFSALATSAKFLSIPTSLRNETYATVHFHRFLINQRIFISQCIFRELGWNKGAERFVDDEGCSYFGWTLVWSVLALMMILVLLTSCIGFGTGRMFCSCCCKPCGCAQCGGSKPTMTYSVAWVMMNYIIYGLFLASLVSLIVIGSIITVDLIQYSTQTTSVVSKAFDSLSSLSHRTTLKAWGLIPKAEGYVETLNNRFDQLELVGASSAAFSQALHETLTEAEKLALLVDGCTATDMCSDNSVWNECHNGQHASLGGSAALLSSGGFNPACFDLNGNFQGCPCCANCSNVVGLIQRARSNIPLNWIALDKRLPMQVVRNVFHTAASDTQTALENTMLFVKEVARVFWYFKIPAENISGLLFGIMWAPGWLISVMLTVGVYMTQHKSRGRYRNFGTIGQRLIWTALAIGILWVCIVVLPLFAILSIFSIPLSSTCNSLASAHEESYLRAVLHNTTVIDGERSNLTDIVIDCLLLNRSVSKYYSKSAEAAFQAFKHSSYQISGSLMKEFFSIENQTAPFKHSRGITSHMISSSFPV